MLPFLSTSIKYAVPAADDSNENLDPNADREGGLEPDASPVALRTVRRTVRWQEKLFGHRYVMNDEPLGRLSL